jgi:hypothetical protein
VRLPDGQYYVEIVDKDHPEATEVHGTPDRMSDIRQYHGKMYFLVLDRNGNNIDEVRKERRKRYWR